MSTTIASDAVCECKIGRINWKMTSIYRNLNSNSDNDNAKRAEHTEENGMKINTYE